MGKNEKIFHESWYQVANQKIALRSSVTISRQFYRGEQWHVLHDPFSNQYYRLHRNTYEFVARLSTRRTVEEVWLDLLEHMPDRAPGQSEIIDLLAQLYHANLLHYDLAPDSVRLFERYKKRKQKLVRQNLLNVMFARIPLYDPDRLLKALRPLIGLIISPLGLIVWCAVVGWGLKTAIDNFAALKVQSEGVLAPSNLFLLYAATALIKLIHEVGHAFVVRRFGGEVHAMGIMLMLFAPLPYTDATASWSFPNKWKRILTGGAGMVFEIFIAAIAAIVWAGTGEGTLHSLAYNMMFSASVTTLLFNINPLLRYDGYYMLCDLLGMPNLQQQANKQITFLLEKFGFKRKDAEPVTDKRGEALFFSVFAVASFVYRIVVFSGIFLFISQKILLLAVIMGLFMAFSWAVMPIFKFVKYITTNPGLSRVRSRAYWVSIVAGGTIFALIYYVPLPYSFKAPGVLKAVGYMIAVAPVTGQVETLGTPSGSRVKAGDTLVTLDNTELRRQVAITEAALVEAQSEYAKALDRSQADLEPLEKRIGAYSARLQRLKKQIADLTVTAGIEGIWISPDVDDMQGRWMPRGAELGQIVDPSRFFFVSAISQREISELFAAKNRPAARVRLRGESEVVLAVSEYTVIPMEQNRLPSSALGFLGGGDIAVDPGDTARTRTMEPFYEVRALLAGKTDALLLHGRSGRIKFTLGYKPLLWQGWRKIRQIVQKHYLV